MFELDFKVGMGCGRSGEKGEEEGDSCYLAVPQPYERYSALNTKPSLVRLFIGILFPRLLLTTMWQVE